MTPSFASSTTFWWVTSQTSGSSIRTPASPPTSKKRRWTPVRQSRSKNLARQSGSRQNGFSSVAAMWLGTMSSTTPSPASRAADESARSSSSPPRSSETRVGSTTS